MPNSFPNLESFTAIDFETATWEPESICQVGLVRVENGEVVKEIERLVRPPKNRYYWKNKEVHGLTEEDTKYSPTFEVVWHELMKSHIDGQVVVAHNSSFDVNCLRSTLEFYEEEQPEFQERCTRQIYKRGLSYLSRKYKIKLNHHNALSDAHACAQLYLIHLKRQSLPKTLSLFPDYIG